MLALIDSRPPYVSMSDENSRDIQNYVLKTPESALLESLFDKALVLEIH